MNNKRNSRFAILAWIVFAATMVFAFLGLMIYFMTWKVDVGVRWGPRYFPVGFALGFGTMALLILTRQPNNRIGWLFGWGGLLSGVQLFIENYAVAALLVGNNLLPLGEFDAWISSWIWIPGAIPLILFLPLLFPDGRLLSIRWRPLAWMGILYMLILGLAIALKSGPLENFTSLDNPYGLLNFSFTSRTGQQFNNNTIINITQILILPLLLVSVASVFIRFNRSTGIERQQLKWFAYAGVGIFLGTVGGFIGPVFGGIYYNIGPLLLIVSLLMIPVLTGMAILRFRLWDIDLLIRKTLQYTLLTGLLIIIYLVNIILLQSLVVWIFGENSELVIVLSTLIIAALFTPIRQQVQHFIDRRFYRNKYNAETILAEFATATRDEMDINRLAETILRITDTTIKPAGQSLWLKKTNLH